MAVSSYLLEPAEELVNLGIPQSKQNEEEVESATLPTTTGSNIHNSSGTTTCT
jgi:hypothetical protein